MSSVVGCDLSTKAIDLVKLDEESAHAEWVRCELAGPDAWARTLDVRTVLKHMTVSTPIDWWDDVYFVAIEEPFSRAKGKSLMMLNRVVGAVAASLPAKLRTPERCWLVAPHEWKAGLGLKGKPTFADVYRLAPGYDLALHGHVPTDDEAQNGRDAYCIALFARDTNAKAVAVADGRPLATGGCT